MIPALPLAQRIQSGIAQLAAIVLILGANVVAHGGVAAAMELAGAACLIVSGLIESNIVVWIVICFFEIVVLVFVWMNLRLFLRS